MQFKLFSENNTNILALGAESSGNFSCCSKGVVFLSQDFGDLLDEKNWADYQKAVSSYLKKNKINPRIILTDLHPHYQTSVWGEKLAKKHKAKHIKIQHHSAHIFSAVGDRLMHNDILHSTPATFYGIAMDGTGYGKDGAIWGGEVLKISNFNFAISNEIQLTRIGHLESQTLIGSDLAVSEPARMLISILNKFLSKNEIYTFIKKYYTQNEFELIYNQLRQNFNCMETSSTGRILDAISLFLGFCRNERKYKHEPIALLEANSTKPYIALKPKFHFSQNKQILNTTFLFEYLVKNPQKDKHRLAATAQLYLAQGLYEIIKPTGCSDIFIAGGIANNKIISDYFISKDAYVSNKISCGDAGLSFGQIIYYLANH